MEFPRLVYKSVSSYKLVNDVTEFNAAINEGWFDSVPAALEGKRPQEVKKDAAEVPSDNAPVTRAELEAKATELGIKFDGRTSDAKLAKLIGDNLGE